MKEIKMLVPPKEEKIPVFPGDLPPQGPTGVAPSQVPAKIAQPQGPVGQASPQGPYEFDPNLNAVAPSNY